MRSASPSITSITLLCLLALPLPGNAQAPLESISSGAQIRGIAIDPVNRCIYLSAYNRNELWCIDAKADMPAGLEPSASVGAGKGPAAIALSRDGRTLACVNRLSEDVTLVHVPDMTIIGTVAAGSGAGAVAALPGGGFAIANAFADTITIVDPDRIETPGLIEVQSVPNAIAASTNCLAVSTRVPNVVHFFRSGAKTPSATIELPGPPAAMTALDDDRFAIATAAGLVLADGASGTIVQTSEIIANDLAWASGTLYALGDETLHLLNPDLQERKSLTVPSRGHAVAAAKDFIIVASPAEKLCHLSGTFRALPPAQPEAEPLPEPGLEPATPAAVESAPVIEPIEAAPEPQVPDMAPEPAPEPEMPPAAESSAVEPSAPVPTPQEPSAPEQAPAAPAPTVETSEEPPAPQPEMVESAPAPAGDQAAPIPAAPGEGEEETQEIDEAEAERRREARREPSLQSYRETPLGGQEIAAPRFSRAAPGPPGSDLAATTFAEALSQSISLAGQEGGFQRPDWTKPLRDIVADEKVINLKTGEYHLTGNASLTLDNTHISADEIHSSADTGQFEAIGNVVLRQENASLTADHVSYMTQTPIPLGQLGEEPENAPFTAADGGSLTDQEMKQEQLSQGSFTAENICLAEPMRTIKAERLSYDFAAAQGEAENLTGMLLAEVNGQLVGLHFGIAKLSITGPESAEAEDLWITTSADDPPNYRLRIKRGSLENGETFTAKSLQFQAGKIRTPLYWPKWTHRVGGDRAVGFDFDSGRRAEIGYYINFGYLFQATPNVGLGVRLYPTEKQGLGFGFEGAYDFMKTPASPLFRGKGAFRSMLTTKGSGYAEVYHRQELLDDTILLLQWEQWFERDFLKEFYYDRYRHRSEPRTFANVTHTKPNYIATATIRKTTNDFVHETERAPEVTFHLLERPLLSRLYFSFDTVNGYNEREPAGTHAVRSVNVARATLDLDLGQALSLTPFVEAEGTWYSDERDSDDGEMRFSTTVGATAQSRFHRSFPGKIGFSGFKHIIVPSITYSYRPEPTMGVEETPRFDAYDNSYGRSRIETKIDNILIGRDAETGESWQVMRLSLYQGNDFWNEMRGAEDYEAEFDLRPRPWWGFQTVAERHRTDGEVDIDAPFFFERRLIETFERLFDRPVNPEVAYRYNSQYADYDRVLTYLYYDDRVYQGRFNARLGFAYTKTHERTFNREVLYGMGYRINEKWSVAFEHRYDFERDDLYRQVYELRRNFDGIEAAVVFRDRTSGWDVGFEFSLVAFPSTKLKF